MARRSARLASTSKPPQPRPDELSLSSVAERDDSPQNAPPSLDAMVSSPAVPKTPRGAGPIKLAMSEMHPSRAHQTMAPPSSGLRLGFTDIKPTAIRDGRLPAAIQSTPSKIGVPSSDFTFSFPRRVGAEIQLGPEARRMMEELREDAARIKERLIAQRNEEPSEDEDNVTSRKFAKAKGKAGRFSAAHMAEFKKMDSIANHPSAYRAQAGRATPVKGTPLKGGIKRSQSKANLDEPDRATPATATPLKAGVKRSQSKANLDEPAPSAMKRPRQHIDDDASSHRPVSRDGTAIPRPKSAGHGPGTPKPKASFASLMTPTKSSLARAGPSTPSHLGLTKSVSKSALSGIPRSAATANTPTISLVASTTGGFDKVKSMFQRTKASIAKANSTIPMPASRTPAAPRAEKEALPAPAPMTTPRKLTKRVAFTPEIQRAAVAQNSPSPTKTGIPRSKTRPDRADVFYPSLESIIAKEEKARAVAYPDLSSSRAESESTSGDTIRSADPLGPSSFTFRSDHTINFASPSLCSPPRQASVRQVRPSILPTESMPGSFPSSILVTSPNKENVAPRMVFLANPHGMSHKKRNRPSTDEQDAEDEAAERAAKKRKQNTVPEGDALLAPRLLASAKRQLSSAKKPVSAATPSPVKKRAGISMSRLNMLSRPKMRK
ncbi:hypothetical protein B0T18DRAFT_376465 [Schizothecium vesticola]|uniref:Erythromycin esterase n=1 Tax=Schizothecium vesticola TaxID=314040 RepID=A0AA40EEK5_9PEZI|nr:hypothetical protein B0T18DRAFT_376465 [Schizothecium vesticola]